MKKDKNFFRGHARLAEERERLWPTQQLAADFFGVSRVTWGQCERGNATPSGDVLAGLAQQGADVLYILTGSRSQPVPAVTATDPAEQVLLDSYRRCGAQAKQNLIQTAALLSAGLGSSGVATAVHASAGVRQSNVHGSNHFVAGDSVASVPPKSRRRAA